MIRKKCSYPCCQEYAVEHHNYCSKHLKESEDRRAEYKAYQNAKRTNDTLYHSYRWRLLRKKVIGAQPYCSRCGWTGSEDNPLTVDHVIPPKGDAELFYNIDNLQVLCRRCHNLKTSYEVRQDKEER